MKRGLLIIDIQNDYFSGGAYPLPGSDAAAAAAGRVLTSFRSAAEPILHLKHVWDSPEATFMRPGTDGVEINSAVLPAKGETVIEKEHPNGFLETPLEDQLRRLEVSELVVAGMMTSMCVDATVRAAVDQGFTATVLEDACAAPDLEFRGVSVPAPAVGAAFLAALAESYATVTHTEELLTNRGLSSR